MEDLTRDLSPDAQLGDIYMRTTQNKTDERDGDRRILMRTIAEEQPGEGSSTGRRSTPVLCILGGRQAKGSLNAPGAIVLNEGECERVEWIRGRNAEVDVARMGRLFLFFSWSRSSTLWAMVRLDETRR